MIAVMRTFVEGLKRERKIAFGELRLKLESKGYYINAEPNTTCNPYRLGAEICVIIPDPINNSDVREITHITQQVASRFGFTPIGVNLVYDDGHSVLGYCGFLK